MGNYESFAEQASIDTDRARRLLDQIEQAMWSSELPAGPRPGCPVERSRQRERRKVVWRMAVRFRCRTEGCEQEVTFEPQPTPGVAYPGRGPSGDTMTVYLTCPDQHTHPYQVEREG